MPDPLFIRTRLLIEEARKLQAHGLALKLDAERRCEEVRLAALDTATRRAEMNAFREDSGQRLANMTAGTRTPLSAG